jgi:hypothetical protein
MDNNNHQFDKALHRFKQHSPLLELNGDFENKVFAKIKKKKNQRKIAASVTLGIFIFAFIFTAQAVLFHRKPEAILAGPVTAAKEEVPVMEDVIFASSDSTANYAIEQVAYYGDEDTI